MDDNKPDVCENCVSFKRNTKENYESWEDPGDPIEWGTCEQADARFNATQCQDWCDQFERKKDEKDRSDK